MLDDCRRFEKTHFYTSLLHFIHLHPPQMQLVKTEHIHNEGSPVPTVADKAPNQIWVHSLSLAGHHE